MARSSRRPLGLALAAPLAAILVAAAGCGSSASTPGGLRSSEASAPLATPIATPTPPPSTLTSGYATAEAAIGAWLAVQGLDYSGDCVTGSHDEGTYCSALYGTVPAGRIYLSGPVDSEAAYWILVPQLGELWYVADAATFSLTSAPPTGWR